MTCFVSVMRIAFVSMFLISNVSLAAYLCRLKVCDFKRFIGEPSHSPSDFAGLCNVCVVCLSAVFNKLRGLSSGTTKVKVSLQMTAKESKPKMPPAYNAFLLAFIHINLI
ncbi:hypothetical protein AKJ16_DCAP08555 [Drosera capensis]